MEDKYTQLYERLSKLQWLLHRHHMMSRAEHGPFADTTRGQGRVLAMLKIQPEISTKDLSYLLGIRIPSLNELLGKLEKSGYIERKPSGEDKRVMLICLTEKGKAEQPEENDYSGIFDCLSEEEQAAFAGHLDRVIAALEDRIGDEPDESKMIGWLKAAKERMGGEQLERLMSMRFGRPFGRDADFHEHGTREGRRGCMRGDGRFSGHGGPGHEGCRGHGREGFPGAAPQDPPDPEEA